MLIFDYGDRYGTLSWATEAKPTEKICFIIFYILQFPFGLLCGLFTGNYDNWLFAFLLNPLFIGWAIQNIVFKSRHISIRRSFQINLCIWAALALTVIIYIVQE
jgi:hypothetical protein